MPGNVCNEEPRVRESRDSSAGMEMGKWPDGKEGGVTGRGLPESVAAVRADIAKEIADVD